MASCEHNADRWLDHLYGLLSDQESRELAEHAAQCPSCQAALAEAQRDQGRMARAANLIRNVPVFQLPAEELPQPPAKVEAPAAPATLPFPKSMRRSPAQRLWPIWVAAAALLLAILGGTEWYRRGAADRDQAFADAKKQVNEVEGRLVTLKTQADADQLALLKQARADALRLFVVGASQASPEAPFTCRIATQNLDHQPVHAKLDVRLVRADTGDVLHQQSIASTGEVDVMIPAGLKLDKSVRLEVAAKSGARQAEIRENLHVAPASHLVHLALNKSTYQLGEVVFFRALALDRYSLKPPSQPLPLKFALVNADGKKVIDVGAATVAGGMASGEFALASTLPAGNYTLQVAAADPKSTILPQMRTLEIVEHLSDLQIVPEGKSFRAGDKVAINLVARGDDGTPLKEQSVKIQTDLKNKTGLKAGPSFAMTDALGKAAAAIVIPKDYQGSRVNVTFEMRRRTKDGKSSVTKIERSIAVTPPKLEIDFYPEGGDLVAGVAQRVYFRVRTPNGETAEPDRPFALQSTKGVIFRSEAGQSIGSFTLTPDPLEIYTLTSDKGHCVVEAKDPFHKLKIQREGVALQVADAVAKEGDTLRMELRRAGTEQMLLVVASCRGQIVGQQFVAANTTDVVMPLPQGVHGIVRLTVYAIRDQRLTPLAERLVYRTPVQRLDIKASASDLKLGKAGQVTVQANDELGKPAIAWALAVLVDAQYRAEQHERSLAGHFLLASDFGADLADAPLLADDLPATRKALDLFLGTRGWRRFVTTEKTEPAQFAQEKAPALFSADNAESGALVAAKVKDGVKALQQRIEREQAQLESERQGLAANVAAALAARDEYARLPWEYFRLALGVLAAASLLAGVLGMILGLVRMARRRSATPAFAGALGALGLCLVLYLSAGSVVPIDVVRPGHDGVAKLKAFPPIHIGFDQKLLASAAPPLTGQVALAAPVAPAGPSAPRYALDLAGALVMASGSPPIDVNRTNFTKHPQLQERFLAAQKMQQTGALIGREFALQNPGADAQPTLLWLPQLRFDNGQAKVDFDVPQVPATYRLLIYGHSADGRLGFTESRLDAKP